MRYTYRILVLALCVLACLQAQDITKGSITGVVRDASGAVVPGAPVKLDVAIWRPDHHHQRRRRVYASQSLVVGPGYSVTVSQPGFSAAHSANLRWESIRPPTLTFNLEVGTAAQSVDVTAASNCHRPEHHHHRRQHRRESVQECSRRPKHFSGDGHGSRRGR